ncbi:response regulator [Flavisolibacter nicotianae]|uniref:response regulator n=1 Tax=Flavisolibacter nicotianae TaxID=2364882 RepID=UPI0013C40209|nr:response regulator [Flavisolibacter nicotianae]
MSTTSTFILFVDDDDDDRQLLQECCEQLGFGLRACFLSSGEAVFWFLSTLSGPVAYPSLIVLDINMPGMGGAETLLRLKRNAQYRHIPVLIHTTDGHEPLQYTSLGAEGFCPKACSYEQWKRNVASFFTRLSASPSALSR